MSGPTSQPPALANRADGVLLSSGQGELSEPEFSARFKDRVAIVIPAFDEEASLGDLLARIPSTVCRQPAAVLVVDDGSADGTCGTALRGGAVVARLPRNMGGGSALRTGYALMVEAGARIVVTMDADGQHQPEDLDRVAEPVLSGRVEFVQGSRTLGQNEPGAAARELGIVLFNRLVRVLTGVPVTDCSNSFRAIRTELLPELDLRQPQFHAAEFLIEALTRGISVEEVPVTVLARRHGVSKKPPTLRYGLGFCRAVLETWRRSLARRAGARARRAPTAAEPIPADHDGGLVASGRSNQGAPP